MILLMVTSVDSFAHERIVFKEKKSFNQECESGKFCSTFDLLKSEEKDKLSVAESMVRDNPEIFQGTKDGSIVHLKVLKNTDLRAIYEKLFATMGLKEIEILEGEAKGIYSVNEFLDLYEF
jgi:hypothetical protein